MNKEDVIRMAYEAGLHSAVLLHGYHGKESALFKSEIEELRRIERFAALVAAAEREACAKVADDYAGNQQAWSCGLDSPEEYRMQAGHECADAIRARVGK